MDNPYKETGEKLLVSLEDDLRESLITPAKYQEMRIFIENTFGIKADYSDHSGEITLERVDNINENTYLDYEQKITELNITYDAGLISEEEYLSISESLSEQVALPEYFESLKDLVQEGLKAWTKSEIDEEHSIMYNDAAISLYHSAMENSKSISEEDYAESILISILYLHNNSDSLSKYRTLDNFYYVNAIKTIDSVKQLNNIKHESFTNLKDLFNTIIEFSIVGNSKELNDLTIDSISNKSDYERRLQTRAYNRLMKNFACIAPYIKEEDMRNITSSLNQIRRKLWWARWT